MCTCVGEGECVCVCAVCLTVVVNPKSRQPVFRGYEEAIT